MINLKIVCQKQPSYGCFLFMHFLPMFYAFLLLKKSKCQNKYFIMVTSELGKRCPQQVSRLYVKKRPSYGRFMFCVFFAFFVLKRLKFQKNVF